MERREEDRFRAGSKYKGKLILADAVIIKDISPGGICFETSERLTINNVYRIEMAAGDKEKITLTGIVVRSFLKGTFKRKDDSVPVYEIGLKFIELKDSEKHFIEEFIKELTKKHKISQKHT